MRTRTFFSMLVAFASLHNAVAAIDLLARYPTTVKEGDSAHPREWSVNTNDIFSLSGFKFAVGDGLRLDLGGSDLALGRSSDGAVWAVVVPRTRSGLTSQVTNIVEPVAHVWLRFHPGKLNDLFPPETVLGSGDFELLPQVGAIARTKMRNSWQSGGRAIIPGPHEFTVDVDTWTGFRRFFAVDTSKGEAQYIAALEARIVKMPPAISRELAEECFDKVWTAFDERYAMFALRPEVDWPTMRGQFRTRAIESKSTYALANVLAEMLRPLRDLHIGITVAGSDVGVFNRTRAANANPAAPRTLLPGLKQAGREIQWAVTGDKIGYVLIRGWAHGDVASDFDKLLEEFRDTRALILDVRLNGGGSEAVAQQVAGRFVEKEFVYGFSQYRNGPKHSDLTPKQSRRVLPRGPWRYNRPVLLLIGQRCMSSNESFIGMMMGDPEVTTMGDRTCGSSGNPQMIQLPLEITVSVPQWIDYLPDDTPLDKRGIEPKIKYTPTAGALEGRRDALLAAALEAAKKFPLPDEALVYDRNNPSLNGSSTLAAP